MGEVVSISVNLQLKTCSCGTVFAVPSWAVRYDCPLCGGRERQRLRDHASELDDRIGAMTRTISALRGAATRKRRG